MTENSVEQGNTLEDFLKSAIAQKKEEPTLYSSEGSEPVRYKANSTSSSQIIQYEKEILDWYQDPINPSFDGVEGKILEIFIATSLSQIPMSEDFSVRLSPAAIDFKEKGEGSLRSHSFDIMIVKKHLDGYIPYLVIGTKLRKGYSTNKTTVNSDFDCLSITITQKELNLIYDFETLISEIGASETSLEMFIKEAQKSSTYLKEKITYILENAKLENEKIDAVLKMFNLHSQSVASTT